MKTLYLVLSIFLTVLILILAFENIAAQCNNLHFLFFQISPNPTITALAVAVIGVLTGFCYHAFIVKAFEEPEDTAEDAF